MYRDRAVRAHQYRNTVYTREGRSVVIELISENGFMARVSGSGLREEWLPISSLRERPLR